MIEFGFRLLNLKTLKYNASKFIKAEGMKGKIFNSEIISMDVAHTSTNFINKFL